MPITDTPVPVPGGIGEVVLEALRTDHAAYAVHQGAAYSYLPSIAPFAALVEDTPSAWRDLARITNDAVVARSARFEPDGWAPRARLSLTRMTAPPVEVTAGEPHPVIALGDEQVPAMRDLLDRCGMHFGNAGITAVAQFVGVVEGSRLIAMAGSRFSTPRWREISQLGTDPDHRGRGLARALIAELVRRNTAVGRRTFLGVETDNPARQYYRHLGFTEVRTERVEHRVRTT